jgi:hypothetical protein
MVRLWFNEQPIRIGKSQLEAQKAPQPGNGALTPRNDAPHHCDTPRPYYREVLLFLLFHAIKDQPRGECTIANSTNDTADTNNTIDSKIKKLLELHPPDKESSIRKRILELVKLAQKILPERILLKNQENQTTDRETTSRETTSRETTSRETTSREKITEKEYLKIKQAIITLYIKSQSIRYNRVWFSDINGATPASHRQTYRSLKELAKQNIPDPSVRWMQIEEGLLDHTLIAAELLLKTLLEVKEQFEVGPHAVEDFDPYEWAIKMLLHDFGRLVTHDRLGHAIATEVILELAGVDPRFYEHPDITDLFSMEYPPSVSEAIATNKVSAIDLLFHFVDVLGKNLTNPPENRMNVKKYKPEIMRVPNIPDRISGRAKHYGHGIQTSLEPLNPNFQYGEKEAKIMAQIALWVQSREGLNLSKRNWKRIIDLVQQAIFKARKQIGLQLPLIAE